MTINTKKDQCSSHEIGTPRDYSESVYRVYFEVGEHNAIALNILTSYLGEDRACSIIKLTHGYELEVPIQCVPELARLLCEKNIAIYQIVRFAKTDSKWR